jgi:4-amino-4-deoxy-L-arabinose transferase-like glycosyltransferase
MMETVVSRSDAEAGKDIAKQVCARTPLNFQDLLVLVASVLCLLFSFWAISIGWNNTIFDFHAFRQTQTAISSYYILQTGKVLNYETPVLGPPWSIPFEFPLYQYLVAMLCKASHLPLDFCGRLISAIFFYATLIPVFLLLRDLKFDRRYAFAITALIAISPHYIYWSRTFMIESTALFFAVMYLLLAVRAIEQTESATGHRWLAATALAIIGALAGLVKVTTFAPFLLAATVLIAVAWWDRRDSRAGLRVALLLIPAWLIPFVATVLWTHHADAVKAHNAFGRFLASSALRDWTFGTLHQRLTLSSYHTFSYVIDDITGSKVLLLLALVLVLALCRRRLGLFLASVGLYVTGIAVFFNLYVQHSYYEYANGIFLIFAVGIAVAATMQSGGKRSWAGFAVYVLAIGLSLTHYLGGYYEAQRTNFVGRPTAAQTIDDNTRPSDAMLVFGLNDWSPEFPYQCRRRAIMGWTGPGPKRVSSPADLKSPALAESIARLKPANVAALVVCDEARNSGWGNAAREELLFGSVRQVSADECDIYLRR